MDSIYELPRSVPKPAVSNDRLLMPLVPDVSLLFEERILQPVDNPNNRILPNSHMSYNAWKTRNHVQQRDMMQPENISIMSVSQSSHRKQVRFEGPGSRQSNPNCFGIESASVKQVAAVPTITNGIPSSTLISKPFEEIYMQNVPNRHLDLSIIDMQSREVKLQKNLMKTDNNPQVELNEPRFKKSDNFLVSDNKREMLTSRVDWQSKRMSTHENSFQKNYIDKPEYNNIGMAFSNNNRAMDELNNKQVAKDEPTTKDLLKIIQQQNEQILMLQRQMTSILNMQEQQKHIEAPTNNGQFYGMSNKQYDTIPIFGRTPDKKSTNPKFAIDVMTSFEVSIRPQQNFPRKFTNDCVFGEAKICEIEEMPNKETDNRNKNNLGKGDHNVMEDMEKSDCSLLINDTIQVREEVPSPVNSIHVDMQDYSSDSDDDDFVTTDLGWTIYNNIMGQVNNVLQQRKKCKEGISNENKSCASSQKAKEKTMKKVQAATVKHLKQLGIDVNHMTTNLDKSSNSTLDNSDCEGFSPNEISFAVKQLLMKYLPSEELAKITYNPKSQDNAMDNYVQKCGKRRPELSFATLQYMKKYNLLQRANDSNPKAKLRDKSPKFLDITALKQQPKLL